MSNVSAGQEKVLGKIVSIDEGQIQAHLDTVVRGTVEETLNTLLDAEADRLCQATRYERTESRQDTRAGHYERELQTKAGPVTLQVPKLRRLTFETAIIERYRRRKSSVEEALIEMYRKRPAILSITHKFRSKREPEMDVGESRKSSPDDCVSRRRVIRTGQVTSQPRDSREVRRDETRLCGALNFDNTVQNMKLYIRKYLVRRS